MKLLKFQWFFVVSFMLFFWAILVFFSFYKGI